MCSAVHQSDALRRAPSGKVARILVVDDEPLVRRWVERVLVDAGYQVDTAVDGAEAVVALSRHAYELVLSDVTMPRLNGLSVLSASIAQDPTVPVVLMTGAPEPDFETRASTLGASQVLLKPMPLHTVTESVGRFVRLHRLQAIAGSIQFLATSSARAKHESPNVVGSRAAVCLCELQLFGPGSMVPQVILLDPFLVRGIDDDEVRRCACRDAISLSAQLAIDVIALGVSTESEANTLRALGCLELQAR